MNGLLGACLQKIERLRLLGAGLHQELVWSSCRRGGKSGRCLQRRAWKLAPAPPPPTWWGLWEFSTVIVIVIVIVTLVLVPPGEDYGAGN